MRRALPFLAVSFAALVAGSCWAFTVRSAETHAGVTVVLAAATVVGLGAIIAWAAFERAPNSLTVAGGMRLPLPAWWAPLVGIALLDLVGGLFASVPMAVVGVVLLALALIGAGG